MEEFGVDYTGLVQNLIGNATSRYNKTKYTMNPGIYFLMKTDK